MGCVCWVSDPSSYSLCLMPASQVSESRRGERKQILSYLPDSCNTTPSPPPQVLRAYCPALCPQAPCGEVGAHFSAAPLRQWQSPETFPLFFLQNTGGQSQAAVLSTAVSAKLPTPTTSLWAPTGSLPYSLGSGSSWGRGAVVLACGPSARPSQHALPQFLPSLFHEHKAWQPADFQERSTFLRLPVIA